MVVPKIVGILNITPDSFSDGGKFYSLQNALGHVEKLIKDGANIIDIGAESTRPNAIPIGFEEEWNRLKNILPQLAKYLKNQSNKIEISLDSYHFETIKKAHEIGIDVVNDVSGLIDDRIVNFIAEKKIKTVLMHNQKISIDENLIVNREMGIVLEVAKWIRDKIHYLKKHGIEKSQLILDVGIGFGKNAQQSIRILKNIDSYKGFELPIYVGHSKKSFLRAINFEENLTESEKTLIISKFLIKKNVDYLRVHDVLEHKNLIKNYQQDL